MFIDRVKNGVECIEQIEKQPTDYYSLILMNIQMPILDGYYTTQKIRRMNDPIRSHISIIAMTANAFAEDKKKALEFGMNDHIAKPIDMNIVIQVLMLINCYDLDCILNKISIKNYNFLGRFIYVGFICVWISFVCRNYINSCQVWN